MMTARMASRIGWSLWAASTVLTILGFVLYLISGSRANPGHSGNPLMALTFILFATVGALVVSQHPENKIGWLCCLVALDSALGDNGLGYGYVHYALFGHPGTLPAGRWVAWLTEVINAPSLASAPLLLLLFPSGRLPSARWRPIGWLVVGGAILNGIVAALKPGALDTFPDVPNRLGLPGIGGQVISSLDMVGGAVTGLLVLAGAASVFWRLWHTQGMERQQIKWFAYNAVLVAIAFVAIIVAPSLTRFPTSGGLPVLDNLIWSLVVAGMPLSIGVAILRYHLYDIDRIINRTLVYGALTVALATAYFSGVVLLQQAFRVVTGQESNLAVVATTLAIAALFQPLRRRIQAVIDRWFYRSKYDAAQGLASFGTSIRDEVELSRLSSRLVAAAEETMQPAHASLWLKFAYLGTRPDEG